MIAEHATPADGPIDEGTGGAGDRRIREALDNETGGTKPSADSPSPSELGDRNGDPQRGGRLSSNESKQGKGPRPADDSAHDDIPSRSFNL